MAHNSLFRDRFPPLRSPGIIRSPSSFSSALVPFFLVPANLDQWRRLGERPEGRLTAEHGSSVRSRMGAQKPSFFRQNSKFGRRWIIFHPYASHPASFPSCRFDPQSRFGPNNRHCAFWPVAVESTPILFPQKLQNSRAMLGNGGRRGGEGEKRRDIRSAWRQIFLKFIDFATRRCFTINTNPTDDFLFRVMGMPVERSRENNRVSQKGMGSA